MDFLIMISFATGLMLMGLMVTDRLVYIARKNKKLNKKLNELEEFLMG